MKRFLSITAAVISIGAATPAHACLMDSRWLYDSGKNFAKALNADTTLRPGTDRWNAVTKSRAYMAVAGSTAYFERIKPHISDPEAVGGIESCNRQRVSVLINQPWSRVHSGFTDYLSPSLKSAYFKAPER